MDKIGRSVIPDASAMEAEGGVAQLRGGYPGYTNIDRHGLHMEAVLGYAVSVAAEVFIAPWRPVAAYDIDLGIGTAQSYGQVVEKIKHTRIVVAGAVVAQIMIHSRQRCGVIGVPMAVYDVEPLPGVGMEKVQTIWSLGRGICYGHRPGTGKAKVERGEENCAQAAATRKGQPESP
jgi:hypothetical protein